MKRAGRKPFWQIKIAKERIQILFDLAKKEFKKHPERSKRYIQLLRKIGLRYNVRLPKEIKRSFCKNCNSLLIPSLSAEVRLNKKTKTVNIRCKNCNKIYRYPYR
jgi:ribonuclease P protein subunit RPR2